MDKEQEPNISRTIYFYDEFRRIDSIIEIYTDRRLHYSSGHSTNLSYDPQDRISTARKISWNSQIKDLVIIIDEDYEYLDRGDYIKHSHIS